MKKITILFSFITLLIGTVQSQTINCGNLCILNIGIDTIGSNELNVTVYNGDTTFIDYPSVVVVSNTGDTIGNIDNYFFLFGQAGMDTVIHNIPTNLDSLPSPFTCTVYYTNNMTNQTCSYSYPMNCTAGINEIGVNEHHVSIFPNPTTSNFTIDLGGPIMENAKVSIYNEIGQMVKWLSTRETHISLDRTELSNGIYFVTVDIGNERITKKLIVE